MTILRKPAGEDLETIFQKVKKLKPKYTLTAEQMDEINERLEIPRVKE